MPKTHLQYTKGTSNKFWEVETQGATLTVRYGRIGTPGQTKTKTCPSPKTARDEALRLIVSKRQKGYIKQKEAKAKKQEAKAAAAFESNPSWLWHFRKPFNLTIPGGPTVLALQSKAILSLDPKSGKLLTQIKWSPCGRPHLEGADLWVPTSSGYDIFNARSLKPRRSIKASAPRAPKGSGRLTDRGILRLVAGNTGLRLLETSRTRSGGPKGSWIVGDWFLQAFDLKTGQERFCVQLFEAASDWLSGELTPKADEVLVSIGGHGLKPKSLAVRIRDGKLSPKKRPRPAKSARRPSIKNARKDGDLHLWNLGRRTLGLGRISAAPKVVRGWGRPDPAQYSLVELDPKKLTTRRELARIETEGMVHDVFQSGGTTIVVQPQCISALAVPK